MSTQPIKSPLIYLACPYSDPIAKIREWRFIRSNQAAALLMSQGFHVFAPISHTHPIAVEGNLPLGWEFWEKYDRLMLGACGKVSVLTLAGWRESKGVQAELKIAEELGLEIEFLHWNFGGKS